MADKVKVGLIGAGRTGTPLLKEFLKYTYVEIIGVADINEKAQGIKLAVSKGIFTTTKPMDLVKRSADIDILIEVSGDMKLKKKIKEYFAKSKNKKTIIMHDLTARLFISMTTKKIKLIPGFHLDDIGIGK